MSSALDAEWTHFQKELPRLVAEHPNEYVLIHGASVIGFYRTEGDAVMDGRSKFGQREPFLVKLVADHDAPIMVASFLISG